MTHLDFGGIEAGAAVHSVEDDGVELTLVQVDHGQLIGLVRRRHRSSKGKLELTPEPLRWGASVGSRVDGTGLLLGEGITVGKRLKIHKNTQGYLSVKEKWEMREEGRLAAHETAHF